MPGYHTEGGNSNRYRGNERGGGAWGGREGGSNRGKYQRYRWNDQGGGGGSRQGPSRGYKENYAYHRYRDGYSGGGGSGSSHQYQSWHEGGRGSEEYGRKNWGEGRSGQDLIRSLSELGGKRSRIALDIIKSVLGSESSEQWDGGPPARKIRRLDWDGARSSHMHKYPYRQRPHPGNYEYRDRAQGGVGTPPRISHCYRKMSNSQLREMEMARSEMPHPDKKEKKDLEKKASGAKKVTEGSEEKEKTSAEETAGEEGTQSTEKEATEGEADAEEAKTSEEQTEVKEANGEETKEKKETETDESCENFVFPRTALKCHMCDMTKFPNIKAYLSHLGSKNHERIAHVFHARCAASMDLLIAESKLGNKRKKTKHQSKSRWCHRCDCLMYTHPKEHCRTIEHMLVNRYMEVQCCNSTYNRANVEEHRLSMRHLKNEITYNEAKQKRKEKEKELKAADAEEESFHKEVAELKKRFLKEEEEERQEPLNVASLPPHDPNKPIGMEMLYKETKYKCDLCSYTIFSPRFARYHFRSLEHYHNLCAHLTAIEEEKKLERMMKEEEEKAAKEQQGEDGKEKEKGKEDAEEEDEDMTNMETVDVAEEEGEGEEDAFEDESKIAREEEEEEAEGEMEPEEEAEGEMEEVEEEGKDYEEEEYSKEEKAEEEHKKKKEGEEEEEHVDEEAEGDYGEEEDNGEMIEGLEEEGEDYEFDLNSENEEEEA